MNAVFPEWLNANSGRAFPLSERGSRLDTTGSIKLPDSLIVAAQINMLPSYAGGTFYIKAVQVSISTILITVGYSTGSTQRDIATITIPVRGHVENSTFSFVGNGSDSSVLGSLTIGNLDAALNSIPGGSVFEPGSTMFEVSALFVSSPALEAIEVYSGTTLFKRFDNILKLRAGENIRISLVDDDPDVIRIDAISGENLTKPDDCENAIPIPPCIRTINNQPPDENGNFNIDGGRCISVETAPGVLTLKDLCSQSCCGCDELSELVSGLQSIEGQIAQLRSQIDSTVVQQSLMITNLVSNLA